VEFGGGGGGGDGDDDDSEEMGMGKRLTTNSRVLFCYTLYAAVMAFLDNRRGYSGKNSGAQAAV